MTSCYTLYSTGLTHIAVNYYKKALIAPMHHSVMLQLFIMLLGFAHLDHTLLMGYNRYNQPCPFLSTDQHITA